MEKDRITINRLFNKAQEDVINILKQNSIHRLAQQDSTRRLRGKKKICEKINRFFTEYTQTYKKYILI